MATGVLVVGIDRATRLLGYVAGTEKAYDATIRLGQSTCTDDADGDITATAPVRDVSERDIVAALRTFKGRISQVPPRVSAVKVGGQRSYRRARAGEDVELAPREVVVYSLAARDVRRQRGEPEVLDVDISLVCSSGTYVRSLARDLGAVLGTGGHLVRLRRTRVGPYHISDARTLEELGESFDVTPLGKAVAAVFPCRTVPPDDARRVRNGGRLPATGLGPGPVGVFDDDGELLALMEEDGRVARPLAVFAGAT